MPGGQPYQNRINSKTGKTRPKSAKNQTLPDQSRRPSQMLKLRQTPKGRDKSVTSELAALKYQVELQSAVIEELNNPDKVSLDSDINDPEIVKVKMQTLKQQSNVNYRLLMNTKKTLHDTQKELEETKKIVFVFQRK